MSTDWSAGYVAEIAYTYGFYRELTPSLIELCALTRGYVSPDFSKPFNYCELGCGQGVTTNVLAAANPHVQFHATDFNPVQVAGARQLAKEAGLTNVHFYDSSFAEMAERDDLPNFDVISLHGIYSWISDENRKAIVKFIARRLNVGGIVYISYNTMPGWAAMVPFRKLLADSADSIQAPILDRIDHAIKSVQNLANLNARYFVANQSARERLTQIEGQPKVYLAHEYLTRHWAPLYFSDMVQDVSVAKLEWVASATPMESVEPLIFSADQLKMLAGVGSTTRREELKDFIVNQQFRRDLFGKGVLPLGPTQKDARWKRTRFILTRAADDIQMKITTNLGELQLNADIYGRIIKKIQSSPATGEEILNECKDMNLAQLVQALTVLTHGGAIHPCADQPDTGAALASAKAFNRAVMERACYSGDLNYFASPRTGGGVAVDRISQLFLLALETGADPVSFCWSKLNETNQRLLKNGQILNTEEENIEELGVRFSTFEQTTLPLLRTLDV